LQNFKIIKSAISTLDRSQLLDYAAFCCLLISLMETENPEVPVDLGGMDISEEDGRRVSNLTRLVCKRITEAKLSTN